MEEENWQKEQLDDYVPKTVNFATVLWMINQISK